MSVEPSPLCRSSTIRDESQADLDALFGRRGRSRSVVCVFASYPVISDRQTSSTACLATGMLSSVWKVSMKSCEACGLTESQALADAKTLGLLEEFKCGVYTCCQISAWANEQWLAWFEAVDADACRTQDGLTTVEQSEDEAIFVPVRLRRPVPWYRHA